MSLLRSSTLALVAETATLLCHVATIHLFAASFDETPLADYLVALAGMAVSSQLLGLGLQSALLYHVGRRVDAERECARMWLTSMLVVGGLGLLLVSVLALLATPLAELLFTRPGRELLLVAAGLLLLARALSNTALGYFWGKARAGPAALASTLVWGLVPLAIVAVGRPLRLDVLLLETALVSLVVVLSLAVREVRRLRLAPREYYDTALAGRLLAYGVPRVPATMGLILIYSSPALLATWLGCLESEVIVIGAAAALLRMTSVSGRIVTFVGIPRISRTHAGSSERIGRRLNRVLPLACGLALLGTLGFLLLGDPLLRLWLDRPELRLPGATTLFWLSVAPCIFFLVARPILDGLSERAYVTRIVFAGVALGALALLGGVRWGEPSGEPATALGLAVLLATCTLAAGTAAMLWHLLRTRAAVTVGRGLNERGAHSSAP